MKNDSHEEHEEIEEHEDGEAKNVGMRLPSPLSVEAERAMQRTIGCALSVHRTLGPGFLESIYRQAMYLELDAWGLAFERALRSIRAFVAKPVNVVRPWAVACHDHRCVQRAELLPASGFAPCPRPPTSRYVPWHAAQASDRSPVHSETAS